MEIGNEIKNKPKISSAAKAAMLIRFFAKDTSRKIITDFLSIEDQHTLAKEIIRMPDYDRTELEMVLNEYLEFFKGNSLGLFSDGIDDIKDLFKDLPESEIKKMIGKVHYDLENPFEFLTEVKDLDALLSFLNGEGPQTIAVVCSYLPSKQAAQLIENLPEEKRIETVLRISRLDQMDSEIVYKISKELDKKISNMSFGEQNKTDGMKKIVGILNSVSRGTEKRVFEKLEEIDLELAEEIRDNMFLFDDLVTLEILDLQKVMNEIQEITLIAKALKGSSEELKEMIFASMSEGRRELVQGEIEDLGPTRVADIEAAQQEITTIVKQMANEEKIILKRGDEDVID